MKRIGLYIKKRDGLKRGKESIRIECTFDFEYKVKLNSQFKPLKGQKKDEKRRGGEEQMLL